MPPVCATVSESSSSVNRSGSSGHGFSEDVVPPYRLIRSTFDKDSGLQWYERVWLAEHVMKWYESTTWLQHRTQRVKTLQNRITHHWVPGRCGVCLRAGAVFNGDSLQSAAIRFLMYWPGIHYGNTLVITSTLESLEFVTRCHAMELDRITLARRC